MYGDTMSSRNYEHQVSAMVLDLMGHDPANIVQRQGALLRMSQTHDRRFSELLGRLPVFNRSLQ